MTEARRISKTKYIAVFATTTLIFIIGLLVGSYTTGLKLKNVEDMEHNLRMDTMAMELQFLFLAQDPCTTDTDLLTEELYQIGERLDFMENSLGADDPQVNSLKEYYSLLEIRHWLFLKELNKQCNKNLSLILYFYSADKSKCQRCVEQGYALTFLRKEYDTVRVYSFDMDISNPAIDIVKKSYIKDQSELPVLIIGNETNLGFMDKRALENILNLNVTNQSGFII
jgi:hypothetical protein